MADLFRVTAPLVIRLPDASHHIMAERFAHPQGLLYFEPYWHLGDPANVVHLVAGAISGDGPWKVGDTVVRVLGCQGTEPALAAAYAEWQEYLRTQASAYPPPELVRAIARRCGATPDSPR